MKKVIMVFAVAVSMMSLVGFAPKEGVNATEVDMNYEYAHYNDPITGKEVIFRETCIKNESGKSFTVLYDVNIDWPESEEETLAKFLVHEGGTDKEKELIADIIAARVDSEDYPDKVKDVLSQKKLFYLNADFWNGIELSEKDIEIAKTALEKEEHTEYSQYLFKLGNTNCEMLSTSELHETENYLFY